MGPEQLHMGPEQKCGNSLLNHFHVIMKIYRKIVSQKYGNEHLSDIFLIKYSFLVCNF